MEIKNVFKNEREEILRFITNLPKDSCIENFNKYLDLSPQGEFERRYINTLCNNLKKLGKKVLRNKYDKLSREELLEEIIEANMDAPYSYESYCDNGEFDEFIGNNTDNLEEAYKLIRDYMGECYNLLIAEIDSSKKQNKINNYKKMIEEKENNIKRYENDIKLYKEKLVQLGEE